MIDLLPGNDDLGAVAEIDPQSGSVAQRRGRRFGFFFHNHLRSRPALEVIEDAFEEVDEAQSTGIDHARPSQNGKLIGRFGEGASCNPYASLHERNEVPEAPRLENHMIDKIADHR